MNKVKAKTITVYLLRVFGDDYASLTPIEVHTLVTADLEGEVPNSRLQSVRMKIR